MSPSPPAPSDGRGGGAARGAVLAGVACYTLWGVLPLYLRAVAASGPQPLEVIAHRALWSVPWAGLLALMAGQARQCLAVLKTPRTFGLLTASALLIAANWTLYVWAVAHGRVLEGSLGYYINPLMNMAAGAVLFRERLDGFGWGAIILATIGVGAQTLALGHPPYVSLALAVTFTFYGLIRKQVAADAQTGLFVECLVLAPLALGYILWLGHAGAGHFLTRTQPTVLLLLAGPVTVVPLMLFAWAARRLPLSTVGFLQFIGPTLQFAIGVEGGESLNALRAVSFAFIWAGVAVFAFGAWRKTGGLRLARA
ncbi:MAG TPA: EamA family transporter RarD [Caulobacteraceae bacterium]|nr:EamA family transporter RarD [Caulobacteraceae bacterium]